VSTRQEHQNLQNKAMEKEASPVMAGRNCEDKGAVDKRTMQG
jgi:hypothetical protein